MITRTASKRAKMDVTSTVTKSPSPDSGSDGVVSAQPTSFIPFQTGPSLERIPDDVLLEVVSYLPIHLTTFNNRPILIHPMYVIRCTTPARTPILRALSQTSRLLRSRCLPLAWQRTAFWGPNFRRLDSSFDESIGKRTYSSIHVLKACPYLLPLIRTVSVMLTTYQKAEIIPAFAACLATLPNLNTIQVVNMEWGIQTALKNAFRGKQFPSVRKISLPSPAHEIIKMCPNLEEVTCVDEHGGCKIVQSLVAAKCHQVRMLKGITTPLTRLVDLVPNLTHASVAKGSDMTPLTGFPFLDTIEILIDYHIQVDLPLSEFAALDIKKARDILKGNKSKAEKTVVLTKSNNLWNYRSYEFDSVQRYMTRETVKV